MSTGLLTEPTTEVDRLTRELETQGAVLLPSLVSADTLADMQRAFQARLDSGLTWNDCQGYERTEVLRFMVPDVLTLAQGFVDIALHPLVKAVLNRYLGERYELCEAKGWKSLPTKVDLHGWHGDSWYDQTQASGRIPREVKLAFYLTDVKSGAFAYLTGTHQQTAPKLYTKEERATLPLEKSREFLGPAGTAILFDTSGVHRQNVPVLEPRQAVFLNYHDPDVPLQKEDVEYYRYHPLLLNAAFLGDLTADDQRILGFGNKANYQPAYTRTTTYTWQRALATGLLTARIYLSKWMSPIWRRLFGRG